MGLCRGTASLRLLLAALFRTAPCIAGISLGTGGPAQGEVRLKPDAANGKVW